MLNEENLNVCTCTRVRVCARVHACVCVWRVQVHERRDDVAMSVGLGGISHRRLFKSYEDEVLARRLQEAERENTQLRLIARINAGYYN